MPEAAREASRGDVVVPAIDVDYSVAESFFATLRAELVDHDASRGARIASRGARIASRGARIASRGARIA